MSIDWESDYFYTLTKQITASLKWWSRQDQWWALQVHILEHFSCLIKIMSGDIPKCRSSYNKDFSNSFKKIDGFIF
jgi:hypothetical protein